MFLPPKMKSNSLFKCVTARTKIQCFLNSPFERCELLAGYKGVNKQYKIMKIIHEMQHNRVTHGRERRASGGFFSHLLDWQAADIFVKAVLKNCPIPPMAKLSVVIPS